MPPWKPVMGCGDFLGERRLTDDAIHVIGAWVNAGAPEGDPRNLPPPQDFSEGWPLGEPDLVLSTGSDYSPPADRDTFRVFVLPAEFAADRYLRAVDVRPRARDIVHHVTVCTDTTGAAERLDAADPDPGFDLFGGGFEIPFGVLGVWVPGADPLPLPEGVALRIPAGARMVLQIHYHPHTGYTPPDQTEIALYFQTNLIDKIADTMTFYVQNIEIPAGANNVVVRRSSTIGSDIDVYASLGHMHYLGRSIRGEAILPDGTRVCLLDIEDWDLHWQSSYRYRAPVHLPAGTIIEVTGVYDNSADNPENPSSPPRDVYGGYRSTDEMCGLELTYALSDQHLSTAPP